MSSQNIAEQPEAVGDEFDVFLSYNSQDRPKIERIASKLRSAGFNIWFDQWWLVPGGQWQAELANAIRISRTCALFIGPNGVGDWSRIEFLAAMDRAAKDRSFRVFPVLLPGLPEPFDPVRTLPPLLAATSTWVDLRQGWENADAFQDLVNAVKGVPLGPDAPAAARVDEEPPYRGLERFEEQQADLFFGRKGDVQRLVEKLRGDRFLAVLGPSGSGKSSLVRAGLIPALRRGELPLSENWRIEVFTPGARPLDALAARLVRLVPRQAMAQALDELIKDARTLHLYAQEALADRPTGERLVLVVDQFEEVFTLGHDETQRVRFLDSLVYAASVPDGRCMVLLTLRADFYPRCAAYPNLGKLVAARQYLVSDMDETALRQAIEEPARRVGLQFEAGLIDTILSDVALEPGSLPLLQHALLELWKRRRAGMLTLEAYVSAGGVAGALAQRAESVYNTFTREQQELVRGIVLRLIEPGETGTDTRRRATQLELITRDDERDALDGVLKAFADQRLVTTGASEETGEPVVELAHEALIRGWPRLRAWLDEDRVGRRVHRQLTEAALEWSHQVDEGLLYRGARLAVAWEWKARNPEALNEIELRFLETSREAVQRQERERQKLLDDAIRGQQEALRERQVAEERELAATLRERAEQVLNLLPIRPVEGLALAVSTLGRNLDSLPNNMIGSVRTSLHAALGASRERAVVLGHSAAITAIAFRPDGQAIVTAAGDRLLRLYDGRGHMLGEPLAGHEDYVAAVAVSPDPEMVIASGGNDQTVRLWNRWGRLLAVCETDSAVTTLAWSQDGTRLIGGCADRTLRMWDRGGRPLGQPIVGHTSYVTAVAWSPGACIVSGSGDCTLRLWDADGQPLADPLVGHDDDVQAVAWYPDGSRIVSAGADYTLRIWDRTGRPLGRPLMGHSGAVNAVCITPFDGWIVSGSDDATIRIWDEGGHPIGDPLIGHEDQVTAVAASPDGTRIVSGSTDRTLRIWDRFGNAPSQLLVGHVGDVNGIVLPNGGASIVTAGADQSLRQWSSDGRQIRVAAKAHDGFVLHLAVSPNGKTIASGGSDRGVRLWDDNLRPLAGPFIGHEGAVNAVAFSPDGRTVLSGSADGTLQRWLLDGTRVRTPWHGHTGEVKAIVCTPDGELILSSSLDGTIRRWDAAGRQVGDPIGDPSHRVVRIALDPGGAVLASGGSDWTVRLWNLSGGTLCPPLQGHQGGVYCVAFSPDGRTVASGAGDQTVRLWSVDGQAISRPLRGHTGAIGSIVFESSGAILLSGDADGQVRLWREWSWQSWLDAACDRLAGTPLMQSGLEPAQTAASTCARYGSRQVRG